MGVASLFRGGISMIWYELMLGGFNSEKELVLVTPGDGRSSREPAIVLEEEVKN